MHADGRAEVPAEPRDPAPEVQTRARPSTPGTSSGKRGRRSTPRSSSTRLQPQDTRKANRLTSTTVTLTDDVFVNDLPPNNNGLLLPNGELKGGLSRRAGCHRLVRCVPTAGGRTPPATTVPCASGTTPSAVSRGSCVLERCSIYRQVDVDVPSRGVRVGAELVGSGHQVGRLGWRHVWRVQVERDS
jgi:hypothetical protein